MKRLCLVLVVFISIGLMNGFGDELTDGLALNAKIDKLQDSIDKLLPPSAKGTLVYLNIDIINYIIQTGNDFTRLNLDYYISGPLTLTQMPDYQVMANGALILLSGNSVETISVSLSSAVKGRLMSYDTRERGRESLVISFLDKYVLTFTRTPKGERFALVSATNTHTKKILCFSEEVYLGIFIDDQRICQDDMPEAKEFYITTDCFPCEP